MAAYIFDTELTGLPDTEPDIIEAAWLRLPSAAPGGKIVPYPDDENRYYEQFKPTKAITFGAMAVHHILPTDLEACRPCGEFRLPDDCEYLIGHSIDGDWLAAGAPPAVKRICTNAMAQHVWPDASGYSQSALLYMLDGPDESTRQRLKDAHNALVDCELNLRLLLHIWCERPQIKTWEALHEFSEECRIPLRMPITKARGTLITEIDYGLLAWCLRQPWLAAEHPYLHTALSREDERRRLGVDFAGDSEDNEVPF